MRLDHIAGMAIEQLFGRLLRRALIALFVGIFALVAVYHFTVAGIIALEMEFGALQAHLIVAAIYVAVALIGLVALWAMRGKPAGSGEPILGQPREMQLAMLVEAVMLGFALARKGERAS
jgi:hypothetical protein